MIPRESARAKGLAVAAFSKILLTIMSFNPTPLFVEKLGSCYYISGEIGE
jgi:hypothetical protein